MAFMTFILMICLSRGVGDQFQPDYIGKYSTYCLMISVIEVLVVKFALYFVNVKSISFLDLVSYCCYKYVGLCIVLTLDLTIEGGNLLLMLMKIYVAYTSGLLIVLQRFCELSLTFFLALLPQQVPVICYIHNAAHSNKSQEFQCQHNSRCYWCVSDLHRLATGAFLWLNRFSSHQENSNHLYNHPLLKHLHSLPNFQCLIDAFATC
eukprot:TRINITY_DN87_c0_g1_i10.p1 TRINITY_DN87_c0_g1~~TRINITY_DN87_c0_g1_i10.p1  ORF type:complete len:207 (-),score=7.14 TRINITY_DN87_c0_g1_i10:181-801(-)